MELTRKQICHLRGLAHPLSPSVQMGKAGYTPALIKEVDRNLADHELIKVRLGADDRAEFEALAEQLAAVTNASLVQTIGRTCVLYRQGEDPKINFSGNKVAEAPVLLAPKKRRGTKFGRPNASTWSRKKPGAGFGQAAKPTIRNRLPSPPSQRT